MLKQCLRKKGTLWNTDTAHARLKSSLIKRGFQKHKLFLKIMAAVSDAVRLCHELENSGRETSAWGIRYLGKSATRTETKWILFEFSIIWVGRWLGAGGSARSWLLQNFSNTVWSSDLCRKKVLMHSIPVAMPIKLTVNTPKREGLNAALGSTRAHDQRAFTSSMLAPHLEPGVPCHQNHLAVFQKNTGLKKNITGLCVLHCSTMVTFFQQEQK